MNIIESGYNPQTGGYYAFFEHEGRQYYADLCFPQYALRLCQIEKEITI